MNIALYQIIIPLISLLFITKIFSEFIRKERTYRELIGVVSFWWMIGFFAIFPDIFAGIALLFGFENYINALVFGLLFILTYAVYKLILNHFRMERQMTEMVRKMALEKAGGSKLEL